MQTHRFLIIILSIAILMLSGCSQPLDNAYEQRISTLESEVAALGERLDSIERKEDMPAEDLLPEATPSATFAATPEPLIALTYETIVDILGNAHITGVIDEYFSGGWISTSAKNDFFIYTTYRCNLTEEVRNGIKDAVKNNFGIDLEFSSEGAHLGADGMSININQEEKDRLSFGFQLADYDAMTKIVDMNEQYFVYDDYLIAQDIIGQYGLAEFQYIYDFGENGEASTSLNLGSYSLDTVQDLYDYYADQLMGGGDHRFTPEEMKTEVSGFLDDGTMMIFTARVEDDVLWEVKIKRIH